MNFGVVQPRVRFPGADRLLVHRAQPRALAGGLRRMIQWFLRGVSRPRVTTRYPRGEEPAPAGFRARALLDPEALDPARARSAGRRLPARVRSLSMTRRDLRLDARAVHRLRTVRRRGRRRRDDHRSGYELAVRSASGLSWAAAVAEADVLARAAGRGRSAAPCTSATSTRDPTARSSRRSRRC